MKEKRLFLFWLIPVLVIAALAVYSRFAGDIYSRPQFLRRSPGAVGV
ncbi:MAG: hypothetical protein V1789_09150 [PVC group bacterium]